MGFIPMALDACKKPLIDQVPAKAPGGADLHGRKRACLGQAIDFCLAEAQIFCHLPDGHDLGFFFLGRPRFHKTVPRSGFKHDFRLSVEKNIQKHAEKEEFD